MRSALHRLSFTVLALALIASADVAAAGELRVLTVGSTQHAAKAIGDDFSKATDHKVSFTVTAPFLIDKELLSKPFDAIIIAVPQMDALDKAGQLQPGSRVAISRVGVGVVVREGAPTPDISTPEAFKRTMLAVRSITYSDPAIPNLSGGVAVEALIRAGILDEVKPKVRIAMLGPGAELITKGEVELGFFNLSEVLPGLKVVGPVPAPLQGYTFYEAAVLAKGAAPVEAAAFIKLMANAGSGDKWRAAALEPVAAYQPAAAGK
jgi:molybdate transport system substrate-binding protein